MRHHVSKHSCSQIWHGETFVLKLCTLLMSNHARKIAEPSIQINGNLHFTEILQVKLFETFHNFKCQSASVIFTLREDTFTKHVNGYLTTRLLL